jgi:hypothetical protein
MVESAGRFLLRLPETTTRMDNMLEVKGGMDGRTDGLVG